MTPVEPSPQRQPARMDPPTAGTEDQGRHQAGSFEDLLQAGAAQVRPAAFVPADEIFAAPGLSDRAPLEAEVPAGAVYHDGPADAVRVPGPSHEAAIVTEGEGGVGHSNSPTAAVRALRTFLDVRFAAEAVLPAAGEASSGAHASPDGATRSALRPAESVEIFARPVTGAASAADIRAESHAGPCFLSAAAISGDAPSLLAAGPPPTVSAKSRPDAGGHLLPAALAAGSRNAGGAGRDAAPAAVSRALPYRGGQIDPYTVQVFVQSAAAGVDVSVRLGPGGGDERARLRNEIAALLAAHGVQIGALDVVAPVFLSSHNEDA